MQFVWNILKDTVVYVLETLVHNLPALGIGVIVASGIKVYLDPEKMKNWLIRRSAISIPATVAFGAFTPFCACGTMAVVLSMMATALPWGPIMAFLTSSPLMSPEGFIFLSGIISPAFAVALTIASVIIGLGSGYMTHLIEKKTAFLNDQLRFADPPATQSACGCPEKEPGAEAANGYTALRQPACVCEDAHGTITPAGCCGSAALAVDSAVKVSSTKSLFQKHKIAALFQNVFEVGILKILPLFALFAGIGYLVNRFIPSSWISAVFGAKNALGVPLAAMVGLPLYVNGDSAIPLIQSLMKSGVSGGAMLAFMITGPGTSAGVVAGISTILKKKAVALYIGYLLVGAILLGYAYDLIFV